MLAGVVDVQNAVARLLFLVDQGHWLLQGGQGLVYVDKDGDVGWDG